MEVQVLPVGFIGTNCYIISKKNNALVIDPGGESDKLVSYLEHRNLDVKGILLTHAHFDHIGALEELRKEVRAEVYINELEQEWLSNPELNGSSKLIGQEIVSSPAENLLKEGELEIGEFKFNILHTPGHSPGSMSFVFTDTKQIFSGDVLFREGIGRTDLLGGNLNTIERSIKEKLYRLHDDYTVYPGHGSATTIGYEKRNNPFFPGL